MVLSDQTKLAIAELVIYLILGPILLYILFKHRLPGLAGWLYLSIFEVLRIVAAGIQIGTSNQPLGVGGAVVDIIGLSPLILATAGVLHEASHYLPVRPRRAVTWYAQISIHTACIAGIALGVTGGVKLAFPPSSSNIYSRDHSYQEAGAIIILASWLWLGLYAFWLLRLSRSSAS